jgi:hypothetical protein
MGPLFGGRRRSFREIKPVLNVQTDTTPKKK